MHLSFLSRGVLATTAILASLAIVGCGSDDEKTSETPGASTPSGSTSGGTQKIAVALTDDGCDPATISAKSGPATFEVTNKGAAGVTELEVMDGDKILGEVENIIEGLEGSFTLNLRAGTYTLFCPNGDKNEKGTLTVTGSDATAAAGTDADLDAAVTTYRDYVAKNSAELVVETTALRDAIKANDVAAAKAKYITARPPYERIEPVAEAFGDLDPAIDARADDVPVEQLTGFHRIEYALWEKNTTEGMLPVAEQLLKDVTRLRDESPTLELDALQLANGANELLGEVSQSKITGEEERYSHIDLVDFEANVDGSKTAFNAVRAALVRRDPDLAKTVDERFAAVSAALEPYRSGDTFVLYGVLTPDDTRKLSQAIDALGEPLSQVAGKLAQPVEQ